MTDQTILFVKGSKRHPVYLDVDGDIDPVARLLHKRRDAEWQLDVLRRAVLHQLILYRVGRQEMMTTYDESCPYALVPDFANWAIGYNIAPSPRAHVAHPSCTRSVPPSGGMKEMERSMSNLPSLTHW